ncbi:tape measure protein [Chitinophaga solisilvae]|uniref:tape measure protein n=1 Tax=Chitinophaga solisilvae TaxID=1233460 RepID=UPI00136F99EC|nr:tape measure protein [Chitinophaga solisilvae]
MASPLEPQLERLSRLMGTMAPAMADITRHGTGAGLNLSRLANIAADQGDKLSSAFKSLKGNTDKFSEALKNKKSEDEADDLKDKIKEGFGKVLSGAGEMLKKAVVLSAEKEQRSLSLKTAFGKDEGVAQQQKITKMADATPFDEAQLTPNVIALKNYGVAAKEIIPIMYMLGDVSGGQADKLDKLTEAFGKITEEGKLTQTSMDALTAAGFDPLQTISDKTSIAMNVLEQRMREGSISAEMIKGAFQMATGEGGQFANGMQDYANTIGGKWGELNQSMNSVLTSVGDAFKPVTSLLLDFGNAVLDGDTGALILAGSLALLTGVLGWHLAVSVLGTTVTQGLALATEVLNAAWKANPLMVVVSVLGMLIGLVVYAYEHFEGFRAAIDAVWGGIKALGSIIKDYVLDKIGALLDGFAALGEAVMLFFQGKWSEAWDAAKKAGNSFSNLVSTDKLVKDMEKVPEAAKDAAEKSRAEFKKNQLESQIKPPPGMETLPPDIYKGLNVEQVEKMSGGKGPELKGRKMPQVDTSKIGKPDQDRPMARAASINDGGQRSVTINIGKQIETLQVHTTTVKEGAEEISHLIREEMRKVMNNLNAKPGH